MRFASAFMFVAALVVATPALAGEAGGEPGPRHHAEQDRHVAGAKKFPMSAADFKRKTDERLANARKRMEARAAKLPAEEAKDVRQRFETGAAKVADEVAKATADGTVTRDEAERVREAFKQIRGHGHKHAARR